MKMHRGQGSGRDLTKLRVANTCYHYILWYFQSLFTAGKECACGKIVGDTENVVVPSAASQ